MGLFRKPETVEEAVAEHIEPLRAFLQNHIDIHERERERYEADAAAANDAVRIAKNEISKATIALDDLATITPRRKRAA